MPTETHTSTHPIEHAGQESSIMELLRSSGKLTVEELVARAPNLSWSQLFLAIIALSRAGDIILRQEGFTYTLETAKPSPILVGESHGTTDSDHR